MLINKKRYDILITPMIFLHFIASEVQGIHLDDLQPAMPPPKPSIDYSHEASEYERKLIQVIEHLLP